MIFYCGNNFKYINCRAAAPMLPDYLYDCSRHTVMLRSSTCISVVYTSGKKTKRVIVRMIIIIQCGYRLNRHQNHHAYIHDRRPSLYVLLRIYTYVPQNQNISLPNFSLDGLARHLVSVFPRLQLAVPAAVMLELTSTACFEFPLEGLDLPAARTRTKLTSQGTHRGVDAVVILMRIHAGGALGSDAFAAAAALPGTACRVSSRLAAALSAR